MGGSSTPEASPVKRRKVNHGQNPNQCGSQPSESLETDSIRSLYILSAIGEPINLQAGVSHRRDAQEQG